MVGFGPEEDHFVAELTYNYGVGEYNLGNDFLVSEICDDSLIFFFFITDTMVLVCTCMCVCVFQGMTLQSSAAVSNAKHLNWPLTQISESLYLVQAPGGYHFYLLDEEQPTHGKCPTVYTLYNLI